MREDKHLIPVEPHEFIVPKTGKKAKDPGKLPYGQIDIIFNHKNIWCNL